MARVVFTSLLYATVLTIMKLKTTLVKARRKRGDENQKRKGGGGGGGSKGGDLAAVRDSVDNHEAEDHLGPHVDDAVADGLQARE